MAPGRLTETYVAALQHDLADLPPEASLVGVVREPTTWFHAAVDENVPALGPPADLLEEVQEAESGLKMRGLCAEEAHNAAWEQVGFESRYRTHLTKSGAAKEAIESLRDRLAEGESIALVCFENTATKRCHRSVLQELISQGRDAAD
ncbi:DUF488 domain-containing protein [Halobacteria archaeon AArc-dxtr1]|nr:DUF488 domain-containing protein [Halobacteria archaeon AArc-dxtr1]